MSTHLQAGANRLLSALPAAEQQRLNSHLERVNLSAGQVLCEPGVVQAWVYFPTDAIVSLCYVTDNGAPVEVAVVGDEGVVGVPLFLGSRFTTLRGVVQLPGQALRGSADAVKAVFEQSAPLRRVLLRYTQALMTQTAQMAVCNRYHSIEQRLCRLLLQRLDREYDSDIAMTQEHIAQALGVRREGVTTAAVKLQAAGLIHSARGHISVLDRRQLAHRSCECYATVSKEYDRLLPDIPTTRPSPNSPGTRAAERIEAKPVERAPHVSPVLRHVPAAAHRKAGAKWDPPALVAADPLLPPWLIGARAGLAARDDPPGWDCGSLAAA